MQTRRFLSLIVSLLAITFVTSSARAAPTAGSRQLWDRVLESGNATKLVLSPDGATVYVAGCGQGFCSGKFETVAYSVSTGKMRWSSISGGGSSEASDVTVSPDGAKVFATGVVFTPKSADYRTIAYSAATGAQLWEARYNFANDTDIACCIRVSPDGSRVFVTGESWSDQTSFDFATVAYDTTTGVQEWVTRYNGTLGDGYDSATALGVSPDGNKVFVTGLSPGQDLYNDYATIAYDAPTGTQLWATRYNNPSEIGDSAYDLAVSPDGSHVFVTGCQGDFDDCVNSDILTIAYDTGTGTQLWLSTYHSPGNQSIGKAVGVSPDGSLVFVTGYRYDGTNAAYVTVAYDAGTGNQTWLKLFTGGANPPAFGCCLAVSADGSRLIVTGSSGNAYGTLQTYTTIAYAPATGNQLWIASFAGSGTYSLPSDVAVTKNGQVAIVTGTIIGPDSNYDWATVAYRS